MVIFSCDKKRKARLESDLGVLTLFQLIHSSIYIILDFEVFAILF